MSEQHNTVESPVVESSSRNGRDALRSALVARARETQVDPEAQYLERAFHWSLFERSAK